MIGKKASSFSSTTAWWHNILQFNVKLDSFAGKLILLVFWPDCFEDIEEACIGPTHRLVEFKKSVLGYRLPSHRVFFVLFESHGLG